MAVCGCALHVGVGLGCVLLCCDVLAVLFCVGCVVLQCVGCACCVVSCVAAFWLCVLVVMCPLCCVGF